MIHYHGTPFSGGVSTDIALATHHAMVSYARPDSIEVVAEVCQSFALDNGAFTTWKLGRKFDFDGFIGWAAQWMRHPGCDFALIPDVIDGTEAENDALEADFAGMSEWCPVWHLHESIDRLVRLCCEWPRVAFGSSGDYAEVGTRGWWARMSEAMDEVTDDDGFPITKLHGLRMLSPGIFSYIPFASCDSTNVARNAGLDIRWTGPYVPSTKYARALVIMDRIENHACAARWQKGFMIAQQNLDLIDAG